MGYASDSKTHSVTDDVQLVYVGLTWRDWEPERDVYDIEALWENYQLNRWKSEGKHVVLRFYCDYPRSEYHLDIPDWLDEKIEHDGNEYDTSYGKGFAQDYSNPAIIEEHATAVHALAEAFGIVGVGIKDPMTGNASVRLGMKTIYLEGYAILFEK